MYQASQLGAAGASASDAETPEAAAVALPQPGVAGIRAAVARVFTDQDWRLTAAPHEFLHAGSQHRVHQEHSRNRPDRRDFRAQPRQFQNGFTRGSMIVQHHAGNFEKPLSSRHARLLCPRLRHIGYGDDVQPPAASLQGQLDRQGVDAGVGDDDERLAFPEAVLLVVKLREGRAVPRQAFRQVFRAVDYLVQADEGAGTAGADQQLGSQRAPPQAPTLGPRKEPALLEHLSNLILNTDSYKTSHWLQYPPGTEKTHFYMESRGGLHDRTVFFGLQAVIQAALARPVTGTDIAEAGALLKEHGMPFNEAGWRHIVDRHGGCLPLRIRAVPEGSVVPVGNALMTVENTDPLAWWLPSYVETLLLRLWYPVTVATISWHMRQLIGSYLERTSDRAEEELPFKLHDFGARGVSSLEAAGLGGAAHLVSFSGTDTISALLTAREYYGAGMPGLSIPAAEHSTITSWGRGQEEDAYRNMLRQFARPGATLAVVSDSYDIYRAVERLWGEELRAEVINSGATVVIRPDSGDPVRIVEDCLVLLERAYGSRTNSRGYRVLNHVRVIQGDGMTPASVRKVLDRITQRGFSAENVTFGMGGGLLQRVDRDTQQFALKCSAAQVNGRWRDVYKDPVTDPGKMSKRGCLTLLRKPSSGAWKTVRTSEAGDAGTGWEEALATVWLDGQFVRRSSFSEVRERAAAAAVAGHVGAA